MYTYQDFTLNLMLSDDERELSVRAGTPSGGEAVTQVKFALPPAPYKDQQPWGEYESRKVEAYGKQVYDQLFPGPVRDEFLRALSKLPESTGLRIRIVLSQPKLAAIPWELAFDPSMGFLGLDTRTPILRDWSLAKPPLKLAPAKSLHILVAYPSPLDLPALDLEREKVQLREALEIPIQRNQIDLTFLDAPVTIENLSAELHRGEYDILQISGHGTQDEKAHKTVLFFEDDQRQASPLEPAQLRALLQGTDLHLLSVIALDSAYFGPEKSFDALVPAALQAGAQAYVGLQGGIMDAAAIRFVRTFYTAIADGLPLEHAMTEARRSILLSARRSLEWAIPALYSRLSYSTLFAPSRMEKVGRVGQTIVTVGGGVISGTEVINGDALNVSQAYQYIEPAVKQTSAPVEDAFSSPEGFTPMRLDEIDPMIDELKNAISKEPSLNPRDRIKSMSIAEELRWALVSPSPDKERILALDRQITVIGNGPAQVMSEIRQRLSLT